MSSPIGSRAGAVAVAVAVVAVLALVITLIVVLSNSEIAARPRCTITAPPDSPGLPATWTLSPEQADSAATIVGVGRRLGVPDRAVTIALATAIQESTLANLRGGDRDSLGLFQQRPSQGWGSEEEILDPVYATTAFYEALLQVPGWSSMDITVAAQTVQRSGFPEAYADHEPEARLMAVALLGQAPAAMTCVDLSTTPAADPGSGAVAELAASELGTRRLSGAQEPEAGWAIATWLVAHAQRLALESVTFDGRTWTVAAGTWDQTGPADGQLSLRRLGQP
ncbi:hypothetical protein EV188_113140 [Actinomycetospora succinea]|uniref:Uncharacterized protein n=1 Tax=Actinomycetospora succinea TaxID=663603 RepID=A0A4R6UQ75_9PSEU|nr:hypothetical protein [Actinomycetospora succinea]TDQ47395.1 hypothetical protein EV188_113140 [Actinomycetospora succinea]